MTTNLFAIANVKQLRTYVVLEFYCLFSRTSWCVSIINSAIFFNSFHNRVEFGTIFWRAFGIFFWGGGLNTPNPPVGTPLTVGVKANTPRLRVSLGAFAKLRKSTISFAMSAFCPSIRLRGSILLQLNGFSWSSMLECFFSKICLENSCLIKM